MALSQGHAATPLTITTWNLEHMMSEKTFDEWSAFCAKYDWDEDKVKVAGASASKPKHLTYCNAHNGLLYPTTVPESLPLHSRDAFAKKVATLAKRRAELNSDALLKAFGVDKDALTASGADYGADAYGVDMARASDHCAVTLRLPNAGN